MNKIARLILCGCAIAAFLSPLGACNIELGEGEENSSNHNNGEESVPEPLDLFDKPVWNHLEEIAVEEMPAPVDETNRVAGNPRAEKLGHFLFYDERLSGTGDVACADCHLPSEGFADPEPLSIAGAGTTGRHAPSLLNVAYAEWYFWDGRRDTLWSQGLPPIEHPDEMAGSRLEVAHLIYSDPDLKEAYESIEEFEPLPDLSDTDRFPQEGRPTPETPESEHHQAWRSMDEEDRHAINQVATNVTKSIAAFEMNLVSFDAPFDRFVQGLKEGDPEKFEAIGKQARRGAEIFAGRAQCVGCHSGPLLSDQQFHNNGFPEREWMLDPEDLGRYEGMEQWQETEFNAAGPYSDNREGVKARRVRLLEGTTGSKGAMKTPTLRNINQTAPYGHVGHFDTLMEVLEFYNELPGEPIVGSRSSELEVLNLNEEQLADIEAFLKTLDGKPVPDEYTKQPDSPLP